MLNEVKNIKDSFNKDNSLDNSFSTGGKRKNRLDRFIESRLHKQGKNVWKDVYFN